MSDKPISKPSSQGNFSFMGTGLVALLALAVLGGGAFVFLRLFNQNNPVINVQGSSAEGGNASVTVQNSTQANSDPNSQSSPDPNAGNSHASGTQPAPDAVVNLSTPAQWSLKFPLYQVKNNKCTLAGFGSVSLEQNTKGSLGWTGIQNFYKRIDIQGTVTPSGYTNLSLSGYDTPVVITFESKEVTTEGNSPLITGTATAPDCPNSEFQLRKQG